MNVAFVQIRPQNMLTKHTILICTSNVLAKYTWYLHRVLASSSNIIIQEHNHLQSLLAEVHQKVKLVSFVHLYNCVQLVKATILQTRTKLTVLKADTSWTHINWIPVHVAIAKIHDNHA